MKGPNKVVKLIASIVICQLAGIIGSFFTVSSIPDWYSALRKSSLNPPDWVFGPVWTVLFLLMGISLYLVWDKGLKEKNVKRGLVFFGVQLSLNTLWSIIFFGLKSPTLAFIEIFILWIAILFTIIEFYRISKPAAYLLVPYFMWVSFAIFLNYSIVVLN